MLSLAVVCACSAISIAQPPPPNAGITGIAHIAFRVSDLDREIAFLGKLGYEEAFTITYGGKTTEVFIKINDRQFIELYPQTDPSQPLGWMHVCFEAGDLNALQQYYASEGLNPRPSARPLPATLSLPSTIPKAASPNSPSTCPVRATPSTSASTSAPAASPLS